MEYKQVNERVRSIERLKEILGASEDSQEFFVSLAGGLCKSSKMMHMYKVGTKDRFWVLNEIDGTEQRLTEAKLMDAAVTNIGVAMEAGCFFHCG